MESGGRLKATMDRLIQRFTELGVPYALVGGYALILHGVRRFTEDIDLLVDEGGLARLRKALIGHGYVTIPGSSRNIRDATTGVCIEFVVSGQYPGDGKKKSVVFPQPADVAEEIENVNVVNLKTLIELKLASGMTGKGRLQDLADVQRLIQRHRLRREFADDLDLSVRDAYYKLLV